MSTARRVPNADAESPTQVRGGAGRWAAVIVGVTLVLDQATKVWAVEELHDRPISIIGSTVEFSLSRNTGSAFSLFQGFTPLLALLAAGIAFVLVRAVRRSEDLMSTVALALVLAGAVGNLIDRLVRAPGFGRGAVVDFVKISSWPTFNVADSAITIGAVMLIVSLFRPDRATPGEDT